MESAVKLGATQYEIENEYYFVDIPKLIEIKTKLKAADTLESLQIAVASNNRSLEQADYAQLVKALNARVGFVEEAKFSRDKMEELRAMTSMGGNKTKGGK